jgi:hypothetical protein
VVDARAVKIPRKLRALPGVGRRLGGILPLRAVAQGLNDKGHRVGRLCQFVAQVEGNRFDGGLPRAVDRIGAQRLPAEQADAQ